MTDDVVKDDELEEVGAESAEPGFLPSTPAPIDDDLVDDDPHTSFDLPVAPVDDTLSDVYGVGAPKVHHGDYDGDDDEEEEMLAEGFSTGSSEDY